MKKEPMVLESNQNNALVSQNGICFMLPAAMGMGGGHIPMIVVDDDEEDNHCNDEHISGSDY